MEDRLMPQYIHTLINLLLSKIKPFTRAVGYNEKQFPLFYAF